MTWQQQVAGRVLTPEGAAALVRSGDRIALGIPEPLPFLTALAERSELRSVEILTGPAGPGSLVAAGHRGIRVTCGFVNAFSRQAVRMGEIGFVPVTFHAGSGWVERFAPRVSVITVAPPEPDGVVRPGAAMAYDDAIVRRARRPNDLLLALVDEAQPQIAGDAFRTDEFDGFIELREPSEPGSRGRPDSAHVEAFAQQLDALIPDGATLQAGIGGIPDAALGRLTHRKGLGVHTEVLGPGLAELVDSGVAHGRNKTLFPEEAVFTIAEPSTVQTVDRNPRFRVVGARECLDPRQIARNRLLRCVNSALQVDLAGQANAEMIEGVQHSGVGGQLDFLRACKLAPDALSILALESTARDGSVSRIVPWVPEGNAVTASRYDLDVVITEHGTAWLRDATTSERAERLIAIAHPEFRDSLRVEAQKLGLC